MAASLQSDLDAAAEHVAHDRFDDALPIYERLLEDYPNDPDVLNDAGITYYHLDRPDQAIACLERALENDPGYEGAFFNLIDVTLEHGGREAAAQRFERFGRAIPTSAEKERQEQRLHSAPMQIAHPLGDGAPASRSDADTLRVAFVCGPDRKFITDIEREIGKRHEVRTAYFDDKINLQQIQQVMDWADVTWFEWCDKILVHASQKLQKTSRVVCRLHRYEAFSNMPKQVNWSFVDRLVLVAPFMQTVLRNQHPEVTEKVPGEIILNGVDLNQFTFKERTPGFNLAYVGYLNHRKNPSLLLQSLHALVQEDDRYHLHIAGYFQQPVWQHYFEHMLDQLDLRKHVTMHGWVDDIASWLDDKHYLVSTSVHESFGYGIAEAMARGIKPVIHHFQGADELFPSDLLFRTVPEFKDLIRSKNYDSSFYRRHIADHYSLDGQISQINDTLSQLAPDQTRKASLPSQSSTINLANGLRMVVPLNDHISAHLLRGQFYESRMLSFIRSRHGSRFRAIDVGAHIGNHTIFMAGVCNAERVYAFEPNPKSFSFIRKNKIINNLKNITLYNTAAGDEDGLASVVQGPSNNSGMSSVQIDQSGTTQLKTIDGLIDDHVDLIKIDTEGMAPAVLRGSLQMIRKHHPDLYIECGDRIEYESVIEILSPLGYQPKRRFNYTPTFLFEQSHNKHESPVSYEQALQINNTS